MKKINTAVIGFGMAAKEFHIPAIINNDKFTVSKVMTRSPHNQDALRLTYPEAKLITTFEEAILDPNIDLVVIATSNDVHYEYTKQALLNNKHVVCEKPFVETYKEAKELFDLAKSKGLNLKVFHNRKYDGDILTLKELMKEKDFGIPTSFEARFDRLVPDIGPNWRFKKTDMAGIFYDLAPHLVHHAVDLFGLPNSVSNNLYFDRSGSIVDDHFEMILNYDNGFTANIGALVLQREQKPKLQLVGTKATYSKYGFDSPDSLNIKTPEANQPDLLRSVYMENDLVEHKVPIKVGKHYLFYDTLGNEIINKELNSPDNLLAMSVVHIMEKAMESHEKKITVNIPKI